MNFIGKSSLASHAQQGTPYKYSHGARDLYKGVAEGENLLLHHRLDNNWGPYEVGLIGKNSLVSHAQQGGPYKDSHRAHDLYKGVAAGKNLLFTSQAGQ